MSSLVESTSPTLLVGSSAGFNQQGPRSSGRLDDYFRDFDDLVDEIRDDEAAVRTRKRPIPFYGGNSRYREWQTVTSPPPGWHNEEFFSSSWKPSHLQGRQVTTSEYHPHWRRSLGARQDVGGPFHSLSQWAEVVGSDTGAAPNHGLTFTNVQSSIASNGADYSGPIVADSMTGLNFPPSAESSDSVLNAWGAGEIAAMKPTNNVANLSTTLIELYREGIPKLVGASLWRKKLEDINEKVAAGEFLNYEFTWKPLVSEITNVMTGISEANKRIEQFNRDSGRVVRRRRDYEPEVSEEVDTVKEPYGPYLLQDSFGFYKTPLLKGKVVRSRVRSRKRWISVAFTYHSNLLGGGGLSPYDLNGLQALAQRAELLLGVELNPEVVYNLTPWSWAVDWVSSVGDVIDNLTDYQQYGLVMPYGYVMEHSIVQDTYYWVGPTNLKSSVVPNPVRLTTQVKKRVRANPFGFGLTWDALNSVQKSILAALGINRRGKTML